MNISEGNLFWNENIGILKKYPYVSKDRLCDTLVIGGGIGGALTAYMQAKQGAKVIVVDKNIIGYGATVETDGTLLRRIDITDNKQLKQLEKYYELLIEWNEKINLTAIKEKDEIVVKHFIDSLSLLKIINPKSGESLIDVGTGAGFPGMVIKILRPELKVTLLDGHAKRFIFLEDLQNKLGIKAENLHIRAELAAKEENDMQNIFKMMKDFLLNMVKLI